MPGPSQLQKAKMTAIQYRAGSADPQLLGHSIDVQFNPESLKLSYSNTMSGGDQSGGSAMQFASQSSTKLSFELWFDVSAPLPRRSQEQGGPDTAPVKDVRKLTAYVVTFMRPAPATNAQGQSGNAPPAVRFKWGAFQFDGIVDSLSETIEFFSPEGHALRSQLSVSMSQQEISPDLLRGADPGSLPGATPGTNPRLPVKAGDSLQSLAGDLGQQDGWQKLALLNDVENPRQLPPGTLLNVGV
jgi:hypothetical protein